jgi:hypothetical protein
MVPSDLCKLNEEASTPQVISIGSFHYGVERLKTIEKLKVTYFKRFVQKAELNVKNLISTIIIHLNEAGVKFKVGSGECLFDLKFTNRVLKILCLTLYDNIESLFRNLVASEEMSL